MDEDLLNKAQEIYRKNFPMETHFERAVFISWYCAKPTCKFCFMHGAKDLIKDPRKARRMRESVWAEALLSKICGWEIGFLSAGIASWPTKELIPVLEGMKKITGKKQWLNLGFMKKKQLEELLPYVEGVTGTVECVSGFRDEIVPDKPFSKINEMFSYADELGLKKAITMIIGLGETIDDYPKMADILRRWKVDRVNFYRLVPHDNTEYKKGPETSYYVKWIAKTRIDFPKIDIIAGSWPDKTEEIPYLLEAGANFITKLPVIKNFGKKPAIEIEEGAKKAGRKFIGTLTKFPEIDVFSKIDYLDIEEFRKERMKVRMKKYLRKMGASKLSIR